MKSIALVNFKGGVGKTTLTWLLARYAAEKQGKKVLVIDTDAQMSLTMAVTLQESGEMIGEFEDWYENKHRKKNRTILEALGNFEEKGENFDFPVEDSFIYPMTENLHFIPSVAELYWFGLEDFNKERVEQFIPALLKRLKKSKKLPAYDYVFFDCPPNFTTLSYAVLSSANLILIPVNPDAFASRGIRLMVDGLRFRIHPWPNPKIGVFMNKAKFFRKLQLSSEAGRYWRDSQTVCESLKAEGVSIEAWELHIPEKVDIKRAIPSQQFPVEMEEHFATLWNHVEKTLG